MNAICLVIDRLHVGYVGAYGNSWIETPQLDRLASRAFTFDQMLIDSPWPERLYRSYWQGWHAMCRQPPPADRPSLAVLLREAGMHTALLTDDRTVAEHPLAVDFDELVQIDPPWEPKGAEEIEQTHLAKCFVQAIDWLESARPPFVLWIHLAGLSTTWDAPQEFRHAYWEQGDPTPPDSAEVPDRTLPKDHDPDELLGVCQAYCGQVSLLDACFGALHEAVVDSRFGRETLLALTSARGFPLGEHGRIGLCDEALYGEMTHVPLILQLPDPEVAGGRSQALVEPADLWATLLDCCGVAQRPPSPTGFSLIPVVRQEAAAVRDRLCIVGEGPDRAIRTPAWYLRDAIRPELFVKPDDRWEINDVSDRCREVVEQLQESLRQYEEAVQLGSPVELAPLDEVLQSGFE
ncbi:MAG: sulfatase-like hydrolase/transferase [Pirellulales bacterium]|nr:sulfatase-like hydrolase/transferase [Pirellulales bacterium]